MEINNINNNNISNLSQSPLLEQNATLSKIEKAVVEQENSTIKLKINTQEKRSDTATYLKESTDNIMAFKKEQESLTKQKDIMSQIKSTIDSVAEQTNGNINSATVKSLEKTINNIATDFYNEQLKTPLANKESEGDTESIDIVSLVKQIDPSSKDGLQKASELVQEAVNTIDNKIEANIQDQEDTVDRSLQFIKEVKTQSEDDFMKAQKNFGNKSSDYTNGNVAQQSGFLLATQANIVQEQSSRLLA